MHLSQKHFFSLTIMVAKEGYETREGRGYVVRKGDHGAWSME